MATPAADAVLFFIPDLGGFTKFVTETEIRHSQHIIKELLELLVDANAIGLKVAEFEGDAVLFYRPGTPPTLRELVQQAKAMYLALHAYLRKFAFTNVCPCGACSAVPCITLKMVAHFGAARVMQVKDHSKFIGRDIIVAHRLLKNSVAVVEYLLVTHATLAGVADGDREIASFVTGADTYDALGTVEYYFKALEPYRNEVKVEPPTPVRLARPHVMKRLTQRIEAPIEHVAQTVIDLPGRMQWVDGIVRVELPGDSANCIGTTHRYVRAAGDIAVMTSAMANTDTTFELWETDLKRTFALRWLLTRVAEGKTDLVVELFSGSNPIARLVFKAFVERKLTACFARSIANLAALCERAAGSAAQSGRQDVKTAGAV